MGTEQDRQNFTVHENLLRRSSDFFGAALKEVWLEARERLICLPTERPAPFHIYVQWLYSACLFSKHTLSSTTSSCDAHRQEWETLVWCYQLASYIQDVSFKDTIMDAMMQWAVDVPQKTRDTVIKSAAEIYDNTEEGSPLRRFLIDLSVWKVSTGAWTTEDASKVPHDFLLAVTAGLSRRFESGGTLRDMIDDNIGTCHYHAHGNKPCYKARSNRSITLTIVCSFTNSLTLYSVKNQ